MYDFIKIQNLLVSDISDLRQLLNVPIAVNETTGEHIEREEKIEDNALTFTFKRNNRIELSGSIHKYFNQGYHNHNDFYLCDVCEVINELFLKYNVNPLHNRINNLEFGVNIVVSFNVDKFINSIVMHQGKSYRIKKTDKITFLEFEHTKYYFKIYNKGKQYLQKNQILRIEVKTKKMQYLHDKGVHLNFMSDMLNTSINEKLGDILIEVYKDLVFCDNTIDIDLMPLKRKELYLKGKDYKFWHQLIENYENAPTKREYHSKRKQYQRVLVRFNKIVSKYSNVHQDKIVLRLLSEKWKQLSEPSEPTQKKINNLLEMCRNSTDLSEHGKKEKCRNSTPCIYGTFGTSASISNMH